MQLAISNWQLPPCGPDGLLAVVGELNRSSVGNQKKSNNQWANLVTDGTHDRMVCAPVRRKLCAKVNLQQY